MTSIPDLITPWLKEAVYLRYYLQKEKTSSIFMRKVFFLFRAATNYLSHNFWVVSDTEKGLMLNFVKP